MSATRTRSATCPRCRALMTQGTIELTHTHEGFALKIREVPAWTCANCGGHVVHGEVADQINRVLDRVIGTGQGRRIR